MVVTKVSMVVPGLNTLCYTLSSSRRADSHAWNISRLPDVHSETHNALEGFTGTGKTKSTPMMAKESTSTKRVRADWQIERHSNLLISALSLAGPDLREYRHPAWTSITTQIRVQL